MTFGSRLALYALLTSLTSLSIDALLPGLREIGEELGTRPPLSTHHVISLFILGMAFGELMIGPLSDAIGRKASLFIGLFLYLLGTLLALFAGSMEVLVLGRFLQGVGVSGPKIATRAMIRDQFEGDAMARIMSFMFTLFILVPMLAPAFGQLLIVTAGWRSVFAAYLTIALILGLWVLLRHPETLPAAKRIPLRPKLLLKNANRILSSPRVTLLIVATGFVFGAQLLYLSTAADLFFDAYGVKDSFPLYFAGLAAGMGVASLTNAGLVRRFRSTAMTRAALIGLTAVSLAMLLASLVTSGALPFPLFLIFLVLAFFAIGILFGNLNALAMQTLGQLAGLGASLIASGSSLVAALFAMAAGSFYSGTATYLAAGFLVAGLLALFLAQSALKSDASQIAGAGQ